MSDLLLKSLAALEHKDEPLKIEIVKGEFLEFRRPGEGEIEEKRADAEHEAEAYFKEGFQPTPQQAAWLPKQKETFVRATLLSFFILTEDRKEARRMLCQIGRNLPLVFGTVFSSFQRQAIEAEIKAFAEEVEARKNFFAPMTSDSSAS